MSSTYLHRAALICGDATMEQMARQRIILFGCGGVGSWCAEALVRSGVAHLTIVDSDCVCISNVNRQLMATTSTIGQAKVEAMRRRLLDINPEADICIRQQRFIPDSAGDFDFDSYDYVIDAIDSLRDKALLILSATRSRAKLFASMGAALKMDPTRIRVAEFWRVEGDPLARALRRRFKADHTLPRRKFLCVYSDEWRQNQPTATINPDIEAAHDCQAAQARQPNGSLAHITAIFGMTLAGLVIKDIVGKSCQSE